MTLVGCGGGGSGGSQSTSAVISYFAHAEPTQETVIGTDSDLQKLIPATIKWIPIDSAPPTVAALRSGSIDMVTEVGNPPVVAALANGTPMKVIWEGFLDSHIELVVKNSIKTPQDLVGKTIGDLIGSSEDYELEGWLKAQGLAGKVKVVGFSGEQTPVSAFVTGKLDGAYIEPPQNQQMVNAGGHVLTTSEDIAKLGYYGINVTIVNPDYAKQHPEVVQGYVCAVLKASELMTGSDAVKYFTQATQMTGQSTTDAISAAQQTIYTTQADALSYLVGPSGTSNDSIVATTYAQTSKFLVGLGRITNTLTADQAATSIDPTFLENALKGNCK
ncbi:MAG: ABC transporter substrate-binding protein [Candidatus Dormibacteraceae bacterium]